MNNKQFTTAKDKGIYQLFRFQDVERLSIKNEIKTLLITANYACEYLSDEQDVLPEDFFCCIEEMKEVMESIDIKSIDFERKSISIKRKKSQMNNRDQSISCARNNKGR
ncbi:hypothetical protein AVL52_23380 [Vibrio parahaemolyticus]|uniref:hypothetical protein n=1 Tax=Vibrio harveyi group TaxID=717610 RepID=UPI000760F8AE|nr:MULTISPECIES: hypothetical protein [Vibrio harveyi group]KWU29480.1 hypothetical protein AVL52_23380 [Vibrio parahaemolyticus]MCG6238904.1 hypothetical protein [Vibrio diabolicus]MCR9718493.1 hypothetical protein [Vibrio parahaemolyticus]MCS0071617.1 hypothetical protein [Vibrio alginolyticus]